MFELSAAGRLPVETLDLLTEILVLYQLANNCSRLYPTSIRLLSAGKDATTTAKVMSMVFQTYTS